ncbi:hypothetical protein HYC85_014976 [Camellia sinensis]|uniref:Major facilitator superfamily (MFS) profile domain-containing protein n=1 Tax=Camellia sinensis TaxID=4442 RepID=A0A7J7H824_CAMSI|nr:hypothetical protein HYC85_014976 [Camellia sinensis]
MGLGYAYRHLHNLRVVIGVRRFDNDRAAGVIILHGLLCRWIHPGHTNRLQGQPCPKAGPDELRQALTDSSPLGRKNMLLLFCLLMSLAGLSTVFFSTNIWIYSALRFVSGFGRSTIGTFALVLSTELVGKRWRPQVGIIGFICFTLGFLSLPAIAYLNRGSSWRLLYPWTCVPAIFYCVLFHFLALESPRWLFLRGRKQEFLVTLKTLALQPLQNAVA